MVHLQVVHGTLAVPEAWTDLAPPSPWLGLQSVVPLLDPLALAELAQLLTALQERANEATNR